MLCYTRTDDYFGEVKQFVRRHDSEAFWKHRLYTGLAKETAQVNTIKGKNGIVWRCDYDFVRTAAVVLRMLMLCATGIHEPHEKRWNRRFVSKRSIAFLCNEKSIFSSGESDMPCPAMNIAEALDIIAVYDSQFATRKMMQQINGIVTKTFTERMAVVKPGAHDIKFWFIRTSWQLCRMVKEGEGRSIYMAVPFVAVTYVQGNQQACMNWQQAQRQKQLLEVWELMGKLHLDGDRC